MMPRVDFAKALVLLATSLSFDLDEAVIGVYWRALKDVPAEVLRESLMKAAQLSWFKFPQPGQLLKVAAEVMTAKRQAAYRLHLDDCEHSGQLLEDARGLMVRCPCWTRAVEAMGRVGQALVLPPAQEREL